MPPRTRRLVGMIGLFFFLVVYILLAMAVAIVLQVNQVGAGAASRIHHPVDAARTWRRAVARRLRAAPGSRPGAPLIC